MPVLTLQGPANTGKTSFLEALAYLLGTKTKNANALKSASRLEGALASSTLPVILDDVTNTQEHFLDVIKSYTTLESNFQRKGAGLSKQYYSVDKPLLAPLVMSCNHPPVWFSENAFIERAVLLIIEDLERIPGWMDAKEKLRFGSLLSLIYDETNDLTNKEIKKLIKAIEVPKDLKGDSRLETIYRIFGLGKQLAKQILDMDLNISEILPCLKRTRLTSMETLISLMEYQKDVGFLNINPFDDEELHFHPTGWVKYPILEGHYKVDNRKIDCLVWNVNNIRDLQDQFEGKNTRRWTLQDFYIKIVKYFDGVRIGIFYTNVYLNDYIAKKNQKCIMIPRVNFLRKKERIRIKF